MIVSMDQDPTSKSSIINNYDENWRSQNQTTEKIYGEIEEIEDEVGKRYNGFKNFDIHLSPPSDHHYLTSNCRAAIGSDFRRRIRQEWEVFFANMPSSIFLRAYEYRVDLMRAAIVAPPQSDFHHCVFFFDIFIPGDYPSVPPEFHYRSYTLDLNPNQGLDGRVYLDFPDIWYNIKGFNKVAGSRVLLALHAIHDMVLNLKHYCYSRSDLGSLMGYEEKVFVLGCEMMIRVLRNPPKGFEDFVAGHFRRRAHPVLLMFKENKYDSEIMVNLFVKLFKAFERNGAYCKHHLDFLKSRKISIEEVEESIKIAL